METMVQRSLASLRSQLSSGACLGAGDQMQAAASRGTNEVAHLLVIPSER